MSQSIGGHQSARGQTDEWLTPPDIIKALGPFDLDPCSPITRPWDTAKKHFNILDNGLAQEWTGRVWLNPPYSNEIGPWMKRMCENLDGIALVFARTDTEWFHRYVFEGAVGILFLESRLHFHYVDGTRAKGNAGGPSCLAAYSDYDASRLIESKLKGMFMWTHSAYRSNSAF
jgi:hypothetical protein